VDFPVDVKRTVAARAGFRCSNPTCRAPTAGPQVDDSKALNVGVAAHTVAASPGGPRFDADYAAEATRSQENGIWLCQTCAKLADSDVVRFPVGALREWKRTAEAEAHDAIGRSVRPPNATDSERKARAIVEWKGQTITLAQMNTGKAALLLGAVRGYARVTLVDCNEFFVTISAAGASRSIALSNIAVSFDNTNGCLELQESHP
jgi:hypothetical protein